ncbi:MAG: helix-turn-helix transcriptional regulator [Selenomonadaceae bacterium]|nr:helix-turn-helix transcriptional regulator [Selenomonadaceae bacterium]
MVKINWVRVETELAKRNMLPEELAQRIGVRVNVLKRYLNTGFASYSAAVKIADLLGLRPFDIIIRR